MQEQGRFTGMAVELWELIAGSLGMQSKYRPFPTVRALIDAAANGEIDVAVTNLSITQGRAQRIDFTHPWFDAGQRIMVNENQGTEVPGRRSGIEGRGIPSRLCVARPCDCGGDRIADDLRPEVRSRLSASMA